MSRQQETHHHVTMTINLVPTHCNRTSSLHSRQLQLLRTLPQVGTEFSYTQRVGNIATFWSFLETVQDKTEEHSYYGTIIGSNCLTNHFQ